jgi:dihydrolipoamide dehydrogenase
MDYAKQPRATYCRPESASVGLPEAQAKEVGLPVRTGRAPFRAIAKAVIGGEYEGFSNVVAHAETSVVLGVHLIGLHAADLIVEPNLGMTFEVTAWEVGAATHPHPTLSEAVDEAAMAVDGRSINF